MSIAKIKLIETKVSKLNMLLGDEAVPDDIENNFDLAYMNAYTSDDDKVFAVKFDAKISSKDEMFLIDLEYYGIFEADTPIDDKFKRSNFPSVNAPAIAFPFLRSFLSTVTVNAGINPIILPAVNFQELAKAKNEELLADEK